jgi:hypothetical protein
VTRIPFAPSAIAALLALAVCTVPTVAAPAALPGPALAFVPNVGQFPPDVRFQALAGEATLFFTSRELVVVRGQGGEIAVQRLDLTGAAGGLPTARRRLPGVFHYLRGRPEQWRTDVPRFAEINYHAAWPGVDLSFTGTGETLRATVDVRPGANADAVQRLRRALAELLPERDVPATADGLADEGAAFGFGAAANSLAYSTYLGGTFGETARDVAVDASGHALVVGTTTSHNFPTQKPFQGEMGNTGQIQDAFVSKLTPDGSALVWSTFLGGIRIDEATGVAVDDAGKVYVTGYTTSENFPLMNPVQDRIHLASDPYSGDGFVTVLSAAGDALSFSTYLGGTSRDLPRAIAVDAQRHFYITGATGSHFPAVNAVYPLNRGVRDAFITKFQPGGAGIVYSTHLGGSDRDEASAIAVDEAGNAYITGFTRSRNFRVTPGPLQRAFGGVQDAFVARIKADGSAFDYVTYYGGRAADEGTGIAVAPGGEAIVFGRTESTGLPRINAIQPSPRGPSDMFLARLNAAGDQLAFSTYFGGNGAEGDCLIPAEDPGLDPEGSKLVPEWVGDVTLDVLGRIYLAGCTTSPNFPVLDPIQSTHNGEVGTFVSALEGDGSAILFSTYVGGRGSDVARGVAVDRQAAIYVAGGTTSVDFPVVNAAQPARAGIADAFALKIAPVLEVPPTATPIPPTGTPTDEPTPTSEPTSTTLPSATLLPTPTIAPPTATPAPRALHLPITWR